MRWAWDAIEVRNVRVGRARLLLAALLGLGAMLSGGCGSPDNVPTKSSPDYAKVVSAFYVGLAALEVGDDVRAQERLAELTRLAPGEPAGWGNWGVLALRQRIFDAAAERFDKARKLIPDNAHIYGLLGALESNRGRSAQAIENFRKALELDPKDLRIAYALAQEIERRGDPNSEAEFQQSMQKILVLRPDNLAALLELARIAAKRSDLATLQPTVAKLGARASDWPPEAKEQLNELETAVTGSDLRAAARRTTFLRNVLMRDPEFRQSFAALKAAPGEEATPFTRLLRVDAPAFMAAPADTAIEFAAQASADAGSETWTWIGAIQMGTAGAPVVAVSDGERLRLGSGATMPFPGGPSRSVPSPEGVLQIDFNYDFKTDLVLAGPGGVRFHRQDSPSVFTDVTAESKLPASVVNAAYTGAWAVDIEADGDLDIVLGRDGAAPLVLQNNGDGTWSASDTTFAGIAGLRQFAWADFDGDGDADIALVDGAGKLHLFVNDRQGQYHERPLPADLGAIHAITVADANNDGTLDLVVVKADGSVVRISDKNEGQAWDTAVIAKVANPAVALAGEVRLHAADLDNNGALDFYLAPVKKSAAQGAAGALVWLGNDKGELVPVERPLGPALVFDAADLNGDGKLDLVGLSAEGKSVQALNQSAKNYHWQIIRPQAATTFGDQRINPFGVGGEIEIRSGSLVQMQPIAGPVVHFGLGERTTTEVARVIWPNGAVRAEFDVKADQEVATEQRLKGSCPFLFAYDGKQMQFVKDAVPWGSAIGLRINAIGSANIAATEEWYKIGRNQLVPHDGYYDLRFTAELWEVYYYDHLALMTVDHPVGTEIFVDERFVIPPAKLAVTAVGTPHRIAGAVDDTGRDVTEIVATLDGKALDGFGRGQYQGVTRDHYVEVDLGEGVPASGPLYLIAHGSIYPTDSSLNVAMAQGERWRPHGLRLEVPDGSGGWTVLRDNQGFPAGRKKTVLFDLTGAFKAGAPHRVRLATNLEVYWDAFEWAPGAPETPLKTVRLEPTVADLHYRGYSVIDRPDPASPELPSYNRIAGTKQRWRDLIGYYTRFGDVRELLEKADDRYVIMNAGDEMSLRFAEQPRPPEGWVRDYVVVGDGWIKDGDYNSTFSKTVLPLPYHAKNEYTTPPGRLEDEWVYRQHPEDWQNYHTRYVTPDEFKYALRSRTGK